MKAIPPATERPMIVDVLTPLLLSSSLWSAPAEADDDDEELTADAGTVMTTVSTSPSSFVDRLETTTDEAEVGVGAGVFELPVFEGPDGGPLDVVLALV